MADANTQGAWPGAAAIRKGMPPGWNTRQQVADACNRTLDTIQRWEKEGVCRPGRYEQRGQLLIPLYSDQQMALLVEVAATMKPGRKKAE